MQPVAQHDGVAADHVDAADMRIQIDADAGPVEPRGDLFDMRRFAGAVIALDHHAPVVGKARQNRQRRVLVEHIAIVEVRHTLVRLGEGGHDPVGVDAEYLAHADFDVRGGEDGGVG